MEEKKALLKILLKEEKESTTLDFKREFTLSVEKDRIEFAKDISAFANTRGGNIVFGKEDPKTGGKIVGIKKETFNSEQMHQILSNRCNPTVSFDADLLQIGKKWFCLLTIPQSKAKPHEIVSTREVWVRRGDTSAKASEQDRTLMRKEAEGNLNVDSAFQSPTEKYKAKVLPFAFLTLFLMFFLPFQLATFWIIGKGFGINNWLNVENLVFIVFFGVLSVILNHFFENAFSTQLLKLVQKWSILYALFYVFVVISIITLNLGILLYPQSIRVFFQSSWLYFLWLSIIQLIITVITVFLLHFPLAQYNFVLKDQNYLPNPKRELEIFVHKCNNRIHTLRKRPMVLVGLLMLVLPALIVPSDLSFGLFTPSYQNNGETFSHAYPFDSSDILHLFIYSARMGPTELRSEYMLYRLAQTQYTIYPAKLPMSGLISIPNPTNITSISTGQPSISFSNIPNSNLGSAYLNVSKNIPYQFVPEKYNFTDIWFNVTGTNEPITANFTYWKLVSPSVVVTTLKPEYTVIGNGTWLESYTYLISNNEKLPLSISGLAFDRFNYQVVNASSTKVYLNGNEIYYAYFVYNNLMLGTIVSHFTGVQANITITFQSTDIS